MVMALSFAVFIVLGLTVSLSEDTRSRVKIIIIIIVSGFLLLITVPAVILIPDKETACAMYIAPKIINNKKLKANIVKCSEDFNEIYNLGMKKIKTLLKE
jgi:hypothetical protein